MNISRKFYLFLSLSMSTQSILAAWSLEPSYYLSVRHDDNIYLSTQGNEVALTGGTFSPAIRAIMEEENQSLVADVNMQITRYKNHKELDTEEGRGKLNWHQATELMSYGVNASYGTKSNLDSSLEFSGIDQKVVEKTGNISPEWQYLIGERWSIAVNLSYTDVKYDEPGLPGAFDFKVINFIDYTDKSINLTLVRRLSEQDSARLIYYQSKYDGLSNGLQRTPDVEGYFQTFLGASERKIVYDYKNIQLGYDHQFNEVQSITMLAGVSETDIRNQTRLYLFDQTGSISNIGGWDLTSSNKKGRVYNITYKQKTDISRFELSAGRNRVASSFGGLDEADTASFLYSNNITELLSWSMDINAERRRPDQNTNIQLVADYTRVNATPRVNYALSKDWSMSLGYRYSEKDLDSDQLPRSSNMIFFTMSWREPKLLSTN